MTLKFPYKLFLIACFAIIYSSLRSDSGGKYNFGTPCSGCHGLNASPNTAVEIIGLPTTFIPGNTYALSFKITNKTNTKAGFNIAVSEGELIAGPGSQVNAFKTQITHTKPMDAVGITSTFDFSWIAPKTANAVLFKAVGNAVNGNNNADDSDQWNTTTTTILPATNGFIDSKQPLSLRCFPNPTTNIVTLEGILIDSLELFNAQGQVIHTNLQLEEKKCTIHCKELKNGVYYIRSHSKEKIYLNQFIKN